MSAQVALPLEGPVDNLVATEASKHWKTKAASPDLSQKFSDHSLYPQCLPADVELSIYQGKLRLAYFL